MILLIDNYDSFSYNLYQLVGSIDPNIRVERNDALEIEDIRQLKPSHIILSPGPGRPADAGICEDVVRALAGEIPILGVCLGHQAICDHITASKKGLCAPLTMSKRRASISESGWSSRSTPRPTTIRSKRRISGRSTYWPAL